MGSSERVLVTSLPVLRGRAGGGGAERETEIHWGEDVDHDSPYSPNAFLFSILDTSDIIPVK